MRTAGLVAALFTAGLAVPAGAFAQDAAKAADEWVVPDVAQLPDNKYGKLVRYGKELVDSTYKFIGPEVSDPAKRYAGNNLSCSTCHVDGGTKKFGNPFVGTFADYPQHRIREDAVQNIEGRINGCMERSMSGKPLPPESEELMAMATYIKFMSTGVPVGKEVTGRGMPKIGFLDRAADPAKGKLVYEQVCVACHGANGEGKRVGQVGDGQGYLFPPLWGNDSYNNGAGMSRVIMAARFIRFNMPKGVSYDKPVLSEEQAFDVSAYINSQPRPTKANLEIDFPLRKNKPADAAFPPYRNGFSAEQHKYGPFKPIIEARNKEMKAASK
jgi:thiosulfate dehydrogenase